MSQLEELIAATTGPPTFHPVHERSKDSWFPGNEAANLIVQLSHVWEDIQALSKIRRAEKDEYRKKLLLKYVYIELRSTVELMDRLQAITMKAGTFDPYSEDGWRQLTVEEKTKAKEYFKSYSSAKKKVNQHIIDVRNEIGAHRGNINWQEVMKFWDQASIRNIQPLLDAIPPAFNYVKDLDLFDWNITHDDGAITMLASRIRPERFSAK